MVSSQKAPTKEGNAGRDGFVQCFSVLCKILRTGHQLAHILQNRHRACVDRIPSPVETMYGCGSKGRDDGRQGREVVQRSAFLRKVRGVSKHTKRITYIGYVYKVFDYNNSPLDILLR